MTLPNLPSLGSTDWYAWAQAVHTKVSGSGQAVTIDDLPTSGILSAHRGSSRDWRPIAPEGSMSAYQVAVAQGAHILDVDNLATSDGVPVVMHDTTVDATTGGTGNLTSFAYHQLPGVHMPEIVGTGWPVEPVPTVEEVFREFGGRVLLTVEPKGGTPGVAALAALVHKYGLERSVYLNTASASTAQAITDAGCLAHVYGVTTTGGVDAAVAAGADLIEIPYNASSALVSHCQASGVHRFIAGPIKHFTELDGMTPGIQGYVSDAVGYLNRPGGVGQRSVSSLAGAVSSARRGAGWRRTGTGVSSVNSAGITLYDGGQTNWHFGDISGDPATSGSITYRFVYNTLPTDAFQRTGLRVLCPEETATGADGDTKGYVISLRANGQINMWSSPLGAYGGGTALGSTPTGAALVAGTTYELVFSWTATTVQLTRTDGGVTTGSVTNSDWRGRNIYTVNTMSTGSASARDLIIS